MLFRNSSAASMAFAWAAIIGLGFIALFMFFTAVARANAPTLIENLVAVQPSLQSKKDEPVDPLELAEAIAAVTNGNRDWSALLLTVAAHESALSARIAGGRCRPRECDHGLAWSLYQIHRNQQNTAVWGSSDLTVQTREASRMLRQAFYRCGGLRDGWQLQTLRAFAGHECSAPFPGESQRLTTFKRVLSRIQ